MAMNKLNYSRLERLYKEGVHQEMIVSQIITLSKDPHEAARYVDRFYREVFFQQLQKGKAELNEERLKNWKNKLLQEV